VTDRLYRSRDDRMLTGVAAGVADSLDTDPSLVRIAWVVLAFLTGGIAVIVYIVMAIVVPEAPAGAMPGATPPGGTPAGMPADGGQAAAAPPRHRRDPGDRARGGLVLGALLIVVGGLFLVRQLLPSLDFGLLWPIAVIGLGVLLIIVAVTPSRHSG
jgi:phage shock protein PspC (stress-responsive transcriptional regulator)